MEEASALRMLRSRLVTRALEERRAIERALHDGVQQDLVGISMRLQLAQNLVGTAPDDALSSLDEARQEVRDALERLRALASDIYPAVLDARGLPDALRQTARASEAVASVETAGLGRYPAAVEAAVAFLWRAALEGAREGAQARVRVWEEAGALQVAIEAASVVDRVRLDDLVQSGGGTLRIPPGPDSRAIEASFRLA